MEGEEKHTMNTLEDIYTEQIFQEAFASAPRSHEQPLSERLHKIRGQFGGLILQLQLLEPLFDDPILKKELVKIKDTVGQVGDNYENIFVNYFA